MPRATQYIGQMIEMIEKLIADGHAYEAEGHVLFSVESYSKYGALSGRSVDDMIAGSRVEVAPYKRNPMDFVLWKPSSDDLPGWDSPWGRGRPGWHIECSAMSSELLGESFDIHGGGNDLMFPHHENEIAQSCCAHPEGGFAQVWMHNEMLQVEGKKMSKSLGNFFTVHDLLEQGYPGEVIRFVFLSTHYRKPMDWTAEKAAGAAGKLDDYLKIIARYADIEAAKTLPPMGAIVEALADDLNTHAALVGLDQAANHAMGSELAANLVFLGFYTFEELAERIKSAQAAQSGLENLADQLFQARQTAMDTKDFSEVDRLKAALVEAGIEVRMSKAGVELIPGAGFDPAKLEGLK
jgi:cysteinyl-tRNA synthetase